MNPTVEDKLVVFEGEVITIYNEQGAVEINALFNAKMNSSSWEYMFFDTLVNICKLKT